MDSDSLKNVLSAAIDNIDAGNCNMSEVDVANVVNLMQSMVNPGDMLSKYQVAERLKCSERTIDNLVKSGKLPPGKKIAGITAKLWFKRDIDEYINKQKSL